MTRHDPLHVEERPPLSRAALAIGKHVLEADAPVAADLLVEAVAGLTARQRQQVEEEMMRIGRFLGAAPTLTIGALH